jgi:DNA-binding transcriptional ArsR family regulator
LWLISHETREGGKVLNGSPITVGRIARDLGYGIRTVKRHLAHLAEEGYIVRNRQNSGDVYNYTIANSKKWHREAVPDMAPGGTKNGTGAGTNLAPGGDKNGTANKEVDRSRQVDINPGPHARRSDDDPRYTPFVGAINSYWVSNNTIPFIWDKSDGKNLKHLLAASPQLTVEQFTCCLANRATSKGVTHSERPRTWLGNVLKYASGPLDRYGKPAKQLTATYHEIETRAETAARLAKEKARLM